jgi:hypothetical protein
MKQNGVEVSSVILGSIRSIASRVHNIGFAMAEVDLKAWWQVPSVSKGSIMLPVILD